MNEIKKEVEIMLIEKKSKFITRLFQISSEDQAKKILLTWKNQEKTASHHCYAWRLRRENEQVYIKRSDDGEPTGTAGAPMLAVLIGEDLVNVLAITTRWFGGTKLGTGGLTSMYKKGVVEAVKKAGKTPFIKLIRYNITAPINRADMLLSLLAKENISIKSKEFTQQVKLILDIRENQYSSAEQIVKRCKGMIEILK
ncbi:MAG: YigZ family protein [Spirochaetes bacterium]|nr:YigZ family protein [Spirochaetota bacterium]